ncbi:MAG: hypothetical protein IIC99_08820 [Chloroflexi bacterium]|nr:hypothetical protein [Chloroflexota bacterium]
MKPIPTFGSEDEEREFWATHDSTDFVDWSKAQRTEFENLKPTSGKAAVSVPAYRFRRLVHFKDVLIAFAFVGISAGLLIPSYLIRTDHEWASGLLAGYGVALVVGAIIFYAKVLTGPIVPNEQSDADLGDPEE